MNPKEFVEAIGKVEVEFDEWAEKSLYENNFSSRHNRFKGGDANKGIPEYLVPFGAATWWKMDWKWLPSGGGGRPILGRCNFSYRGLEFQYIVRVFDGNEWRNVPFWGDSHDEEKYQRYQNYWVVEDLRCGETVLMELDQSSGNHRMYHYIHPDRWIPLAVGFEQYLDAMLTSYGTYGWLQRLYAPEVPLDGRIPDHFVRNMKLLLPDKDISLFRPDPELEDSIFNRYVAATDNPDPKGDFLAAVAKLQADDRFRPNIWRDALGAEYDHVAGSGVSEAVLRKAMRDYGREISPQMYRFYGAMDGCRLDWMFTGSDGVERNAKFELLPLDIVLGGDGGKNNRNNWASPDLYKIQGRGSTYLTEEDADEFPELAEFYRSARLFERYEPGYETFLKFELGLEEPGIYIVRDMEVYKLRLDFEGFVNLRLRFLGMGSLDVLFIDESDWSRYHGSDPFEKIKEFKLQSIRKIWPDATFDDWGI